MVSGKGQQRERPNQESLRGKGSLCHLPILKIKNGFLPLSNFDLKIQGKITYPLHISLHLSCLSSISIAHVKCIFDNLTK